MIFAQATSADVATWTSIANSVTQLGFAVFIAMYFAVYGLPKQQATFDKAIAAVIATFEKVVADERARADARELRKENDSKERSRLTAEEYKVALDKVIQHCERESARRDASMTVVDKSLINVGEVLEGVRDEMRESRLSRRIDPDDTPPNSRVRKNA